ncbi:helix-turn-helix transcriptional regulator (plasmid) [Brevibacillus halotolerans]|nr:helix-turn-helix transcriptional regulator [Brevibacillus halotolerans]
MEQNIHNYLQQCRINQKLSIQELSKRSGVSASHISRVERENRNPSPETLEKLSPHLQIEYVKLLEVANLLEKKEKQIIHLEEVLNHPRLFLNGQLIDENLRHLLLKSIAY